MRRWFTQEVADALIERLWVIADIVPDPPRTSAYSRDPHDDYLVALALRSGDALISGDRDLLSLAAPPDVLTPRQLLDRFR
jgi:predicted nucleic acid-binding protein